MGECLVRIFLKAERMWWWEGELDLGEGARRGQEYGFLAWICFLDIFDLAVVLASKTADSQQLDFRWTMICHGTDFLLVIAQDACD